MLLVDQASAAAGITYHGRILQSNGQPVSATNVQFRLQIRSPGSENCLLYEELQTKNLSQSNGTFAITINDGTGTRTDPGAYAIDRLFQNRGIFSLTGLCALGNTYVPNSADGRRIAVEFNDGSGWEPMPSQLLNYVPLSIEAMSVGGYNAGNLLRIEDAGIPQTVSAMTSTQLSALLNVANTGNITGNAATAVTAGSATNFTGSLAGDVTGTQAATVVARLQGRAVSATAPANGEVLKWNGTAWAPATDGGAGGGVTAVSASAPLASSGGATPDISLAVGTVTGQTLRWGGASWSAAKLNYQDLVNNVAASPWPGASCTSGQFLTWSSVSDNFACTALSGAMVNTALGYTPLNPANNLSDVANAATARANIGAGDFLASGSVAMTGNLRLNNNWLSNDGGNEGLRVDNNGNVGIGTGTPGYKLEILDTASGVGNGVMFRNGTAPDKAGLHFSTDWPAVGFNRYYDGSDERVIGTGFTSTIQMNPATGLIQFNTSNGSATSGSILSSGTRMTITNAGNVGIGTSSPQSSLHVNGTIRANEVCDENGANCRDISTGWGGGGTVTSVTSANADIGVATTTSTPVLTLNSGTGANQILKLNASSEIPAVSGVNLTALNASNLGSGTVPAARMPALTGDATMTAGTTATTVARIRGNNVAATTPLDGQVYRWNNGATQWEPVYFGVDDLRTSVGASQFSASCTASQTLTWSAVSDAFVCANIAGLDAAVISTGTIAAARLPASASFWDTATGGINYAGGNVGIGTTSPARLLHVNAPIRLAPSGLPGSPGAGDVAIDSSDSNKLKYFDGTSWVTAGIPAGNVSQFPNIPNRALSSATGASNPVLMPSQVSAGELLVVVFTAKSGTHGYPVGWTKITETGVYPFVSVAYKVSDGSEAGTTITVTTSTSDRNSHQVFRIRDYQGAPEVATAAGSSLNPDPPSLTPSWGSANTLWLSVASYHLNGNSISSYPAGYSNGLNSDVGGSDPKTAVAFRQAQTASENPGTFTLASSNSWTAATIAIRPGPNGSSSVSDNLGNHTATQNLRLGNFWLSSDGDAEGLSVNSSGNVGIGTSSPQDIFHVKQSTAGTTTLNNVAILEASSTGDMADGFGSIISFRISDNGIGQTAIGSIGVMRDGADNSGKMIFRTGNAGVFDYRMAIDKTGNVGIGTTSPTAKLEVQGQIVSRVYNNGASTTFDFANGNSQYTSASCGALTLSNMIDGGSYTIAILGTTAGTCTFSHTGLTFLSNYSGPTTAGTRTLISFQRMGTFVFVNWNTGYQ